jgi:3-deoxy-manno-octulosonate cytidylyltransferase (CMP-KDO synthetase)
VLHLIQAEMILNVQGDEPMVDPGMLEDLISAWREIHPDLVTPVYPILSEEDLSNPNIVKVARGKDGRAVYFSRSPIPYLRDVPRPDWVGQKSHWGHIGVYGYSRRVLEAYPFLPASLLESQEHLEQLRFLEAGYQIITIETDYHSIAVDTPDDLDLVRQRIGRDYEPY